MAANQKQGRDWMKMPCTDVRMEDIVLGIYKEQGYRILWELVREVGREYGYYAKWDSKYCIIFARKHGFMLKNVQGVVRECLADGFFCEEKFIEHSILTSEKFQHEWLYMAKDRKEIIVTAEFLFSSTQEILNKILEKRNDFKNSKVNDNEADNDSFRHLLGANMALDTHELATNLVQNSPLNSDKDSIAEDRIVKQSIAEQNFSTPYLSTHSYEQSEPLKNSLSGLGKEVDEDAIEKKEKNFTEGAGEKKPKSQKHPARDEFLKVWENFTGTVYAQSFAENQSVKNIITILENQALLELKNSDTIINQQVINDNIIRIWTQLVQNWNNMKPFLAGQKQFNRIEKYFNEIFRHYKPIRNDLKEIDSKVTVQSISIQPNPISVKKTTNKSKSALPYFSEFWELYDKKVGLEKAEKAWEQITPNDWDDMKQHIPNYKIAEPNKKFRQHPTTYLNQKSWKDEIIKQPIAEQTNAQPEYFAPREIKNNPYANA